jgi:hypothetical protein
MRQLQNSNPATDRAKWVREGPKVKAEARPSGVPPRSTEHRASAADHPAPQDQRPVPRQRRSVKG